MYLRCSRKLKQTSLQSCFKRVVGASLLMNLLPAHSSSPPAPPGGDIGPVISVVGMAYVWNMSIAKRKSFVRHNALCCAENISTNRDFRVFLNGSTAFDRSAVMVRVSLGPQTPAGCVWVKRARNLLHSSNPDPVRFTVGPPSRSAIASKRTGFGGLLYRSFLLISTGLINGRALKVIVCTGQWINTRTYTLMFLRDSYLESHWIFDLKHSADH